jgi:hypothetical protein
MTLSPVERPSESDFAVSVGSEDEVVAGLLVLVARLEEGEGLAVVPVALTDEGEFVVAARRFVGYSVERRGRGCDSPQMVCGVTLGSAKVKYSAT